MSLILNQLKIANSLNLLGALTASYISSSGAMSAGGNLTVNGTIVSVGTNDGDITARRISTSRYAIYRFNTNGSDDWVVGVRGSGEGFSDDLTFRNGAGSVVSRLSQSGNATFSGNVGIGTTSPSYKLEVSGSIYANPSTTDAYIISRGSGAYLKLESTIGGYSTIFGNDGSTTRWAIGQFGFVGDGLAFYYGSSLTEAVRINSSGNFGIGTTSPAQKLDVDGGTSPVQIQLKETSTAYHRVGLRKSGSLFQIGEPSNDGTSTYTPIFTVDMNGDNVGIGTTVPSYKLDISGVARSTQGWISTGAYAGMGSVYGSLMDYNSGNVRFVGNTNGSNATFEFISGNTGTFTSRMYIDGSGNVGIGTTSPSVALDVQRTTATAANFQLTSASNSVVASVQQLNAGGNDVPHGLYIDVRSTAGSGFDVYNNTTPILVTKIGGNVGIGTASPSEKLDVVGNAIKLYKNDTYARVDIGTTNNRYYVQVEDNTFDGFGIYQALPGAGAGWKFAINTDGNVGIGTTTPRITLDTGYTRIYNTGAAGTPSAGKGLELHYVTSGRTQGEGSYLISYDRDGSAYKNLTIDAANIFLYPQSSGVGIGTFTPNAKLDVNGNAVVSGSLTLTNNLALGGATFPSWNGTFRLIQFGDDAIYGSPSTGGTLRLLSNLYYSTSGWKRRSTGYGTFLSLENASFTVSVAGYNSADTVASLTEVFTIAQTTNIATFAGLVVANSGIIVTGSLRVTGLIYDSTNSSGSNGQVLTSTGTGSLWSSTGAGVSGTGTTNYVPKFTAASTLGNSVIQDDGTNIGIGITPTSQANYRFLQISGTSSAIIETMVGSTRIGGFDSDASALYVGTISNLPISFRIAVVEKMRLTTAGNLGIGTTSPTAKLHLYGQFESNYALKVEGTYGTGHEYGWKTNGGNSEVLSLYSITTGYRLAFFGNSEAGFATTNGTTRLYINSSGYVGIGTTSPGYQFSLVSSNQTPAGIEHNYNNSGSSFGDALFLVNTNQGDTRYVQMGLSTNGSDGQHHRGGIRAYKDPNILYGGILGLYTRGTSAAWNESMTILGSGNVGISSTNPSYRLTVNVASTGVGVYAYNGGNYLQMGGMGSGTTYFKAYETIVAYGNIYGGYVTFLVGDAEKVRIDNSGNVGIGTSSPSSNLHVYTTGTGVELALEKSNTYAVKAGVNSSNIGYFGSTNATAVQIQTNGSARMYFDTSGNVGINKTTPNAKLDVNGNAIISGSITTTSTLSVSNGFYNNQQLTVPASSTRYLYVDINGSYGSVFVYVSGYVSAGQGSCNISWIDGGHGGGTTYHRVQQISRLTQPSNGNPVLGSLIKTSGGAAISIQNTSATDPLVLFVTTQAYNASLVDCAVSLTTSAPTGDDVSHLNVTDVGNIGIGKTTPNAKLDVNGNTIITGSLTSSLDSSINSINVGRGKGSQSANTSVGSSALSSNTTGNYNTALGYQSLQLNTTGASNTSVGYNALQFNQIGNANTAVGNNALYISTAYFNTAIGADAMGQNTTGGENAAVGFRALANNSTAYQNTAMGYSALQYTSTGGWNSAFGWLSMQNNRSGSENSAFGSQAGLDITSGSKNTLIGFNTGRGIVSGSYNTIIGSEVTGLSSTLSNTIILADGQGNIRYYADSSGNTAIGKTTPTAKLDVTGSAFITGSLSVTDTITAPNIYGTSYTSLVDSGSGVAYKDTITTSGVGLYELSIVANPNAGGSSNYRDFLYGKIIIGTGWNGSALTDYVSYVQENPDPRSLYTSGGSTLSVDVRLLSSGVEYNSLSSGTTYTLRVKISGYNASYSGQNTTIRLRRMM